LVKTRLITSGNLELLETQAAYLFLNRQVKDYCQGLQKYVGSPKTQEKQLSMQTLAT
jgi:hypothetical protein